MTSVPYTSPVPRSLHLFPSATLLLLSWGALMFGSEFSWAYAPLLVFSVAVGVLGIIAGKGEGPSLLQSYRAGGARAGARDGRGHVQVAPLPPSVVASVSPARNNADYPQLFAKYTMREVDESAAKEAPRTISIEPSRTLLGLAFLGAFSFLLVGSARGLGGVRPTGLVRGIVILGAVAAFLEIFQKASHSAIVYGLFIPRQPGIFSAPFVNRNHTAGFLAMVLALSLGHLAGCLARGMRGVRAEWRDRILWLSSADASETLLTGFAVAVMAIAIVLTESRSGALCLVLASVLFAWWGAQRQASRSRKVLTSLHVTFVLVAAAIMGGANVVIQRFATESLETPGGRWSIWQDALRIIHDFPLVGTGFNTFGIAMLNYQAVKQPFLYIEAHNDYLQIAAEGGALLGVPVLILVGVFIHQVRRRFREGADDTRTYWLRAGAVTGLCTIAFQSLFDFTLQMPGAAALFVVLAAIALHHPRQQLSRASA